MSRACRRSAARLPTRISCRVSMPRSVSALKAAGAIVTCKTTTCESGYKLTADSPVSGVTRNPWNLGRTSGGSSGGAAASIAAGCGPLAIGTDGVGSIRVPSSFCGVFGIKPTFGWCRGRPVFRRRHGRRWRTPDRSRVRSPTRRCFWKSSRATTCAMPAACRSPRAAFAARGRKLDGMPDRRQRRLRLRRGGARRAQGLQGGRCARRLGADVRSLTIGVEPDNARTDAEADRVYRAGGGRIRTRSRSAR